MLFRSWTAFIYRTKHGGWSTTGATPPWELLDDLAAKLRSLGAAATVIAPYWPKQPWFAHLSFMSIETIDMPPSRDLFSPQKRLGQGGSDLLPGASWLSTSHSAVDAVE